MPFVLFPTERKGLAPEEITLAELLKERGYATACIGKWHLGFLPPFQPMRQGFDEFFGLPYSNDSLKQPPGPAVQPGARAGGIAAAARHQRAWKRPRRRKR